MNPAPAPENEPLRTATGPFTDYALGVEARLTDLTQQVALLRVAQQGTDELLKQLLAELRDRDA